MLVPMIIYKGQSSHQPNWNKMVAEIIQEHQGKLIVELSPKAYGSHRITKEYHSSSELNYSFFCFVFYIFISFFSLSFSLTLT